MQLLLILPLMLAASIAQALTVMGINTEFLWDDKSPHEGRIINMGKAPTTVEYEREVNYYVNMIKKNKADIVGLTEIEGCHVSAYIASKLGNGWVSICKKGRDTFTGQDVAILTRLKFDGSYINNHKTSYADITEGKKKGKRVRPSKVISAVVVNGDTRILVTVAHLISRKRNSDFKRQAQARAIRNTLDSDMNDLKVGMEILMGDINDFPGSKTIQILKGHRLASSDLAGDCSYIYRGDCNLIDHILHSNWMKGGTFRAIEVPRIYSDHKTVKYSF